LVLFIYILLLGVNVYIWEKSNINYKKDFNMQLIYVNSFLIMIVGFCFLALWMLVFLYCGLSSSKNFGADTSFFRKSFAAYLPPFLWVVFFIFLFFPTKKWLFGKARLFVIKTLLGFVIGPFTDHSTLTSVAFDNSMSFVTVYRDFAYTFCYFSDVISDGEGAFNTCDRYPFKTAYLVVTVVPLFYKLLYIVNRFYFEVKNTNRTCPFRGVVLRNLFNLFKICGAMLVSFLSFFSQDSDGIFISWLILSIVSAIIFWSWDATIDWGFFINGRLIRDKTVFHSRLIYYGVLFANLAMRCSWIMTLSYFTSNSVLTNNIVTITVAITEIFRMVIWNIFKVEYDHIKFIGKFRSMNDDDIPFPVIVDMSDAETNKFVNYLFDRYLEFVQINKDLEKKDYGFSSLDENLLKFMNRNAPEASQKVSFPSSINDQDYYFVEEEHETAGLHSYNRSLKDCFLFLESIEPKLKKFAKTEKIFGSKRAKNHIRRYSKYDSAILLYDSAILLSDDQAIEGNFREEVFFNALNDIKETCSF
jgi:hypothetical protein